MQEREGSALLRDEILCDIITDSGEATALCKEVQEEEYVIHVVGFTNFYVYTRLRFCLLASTWFPRPLGVCLWSALHMFLAFYEATMLFVLYSIIFVPAVLIDVYIAAILIGTVLFLPFALILVFITMYCIPTALACLWLVITCKCCTMPARAPGQSLHEYIFTTAFGTTLHRVLTWPNEPRPVVGGPTAAVDGGAAPAVHGEAHESFWRVLFKNSLTFKFVNYVVLVSYPYRRAQLGDLCREIVPWYDAVVI